MPFDEDRHIQQLVELYRRGFEEILRLIVEKEARGLWSTYWRDVLLEVYKILHQLDEEARTWIQTTISQVYSIAAAETVAFLSSLGVVKQQRPEFAQLHQRAIDVLAQNMADNLRDATQFVGRRVRDIFRRVQLEQAGIKYASGATVQDMKQKVIQELLNRGQTAFKDRLGREWRLDTYAEMVARTVTREAATVAVLNQCREFGVDLVRVSTHYPTCHLCAPYQGKVFSISGDDPRYPRLTRRPPFHPNCRHVLLPYIRELDPQADKVERLSNEPIDPDRDIRSEAEKQAYKEMRDRVTIATTRRRAREVLLNEAAPLEEKLKAARQLQRSYEKTGTKPVGKDAAILKQYRSWLNENAKFGVITPENSFIPEAKLVQYALNKDHPKGRDKAIAFERALGYNISNYQDLMDNILRNLSKYPAVLKAKTPYGDKYEVVMELVGPNGKTARVLTAWMLEKNGKARLVTTYVDE